MCVYLCAFIFICNRLFLQCGTFAKTPGNDTRINCAEHYKQTFKRNWTIYSKKGNNETIFLKTNVRSVQISFSEFDWLNSINVDIFAYFCFNMCYEIQTGHNYEIKVS